MEQVFNEQYVFSDETNSPLFVPDTTQVHLIIHLANSAIISAKLENRRASQNYEPGTFSLVLQGTPSQSSMKHFYAYGLVVCIDHEVMERTAEKVFDSSPYFDAMMNTLANDDSIVDHLLLAIYQELVTPGFASISFIDSLAQTLVIHLLRNYAILLLERPESRGNLPSSILKTIMDYIHSHLDRNILLQEVAIIAHLSTSHLARLFKKTTGVTVHQYVLQKRLEAGKELLLKGGMTITEVAARTGFVDASHFSRHFKRRYGNSAAFKR